METRAQWYKQNLLYNIHWRPPKKPEPPKMIVETVRFNASVCTCGEHGCEPRYRMEKRVLWTSKEMSDSIKNTGGHTDGTDKEGGRGKSRLNDNNDGKKLPDDKKDDSNCNNGRAIAECVEKTVADDLKKYNVKENSGEHSSEDVCNVGLREGEKYKERSGGRFYHDYLGSLKVENDRERSDKNEKDRKRNDAKKGEEEIKDRERNGDDRERECNSSVDIERFNVKTDNQNGKNGSS